MQGAWSESGREEVLDKSVTVEEPGRACLWKSVVKGLLRSWRVCGLPRIARAHQLKSQLP